MCFIVVVVLFLNRPFYRYGGHIELIRFKEYYGMPRGHEHDPLYQLSIRNMVFVEVIARLEVIFGIIINSTSDISKLLYVISRAVRRVKFETILKYHSWYLCQISRTLSQSNCRNFSCSSITLYVSREKGGHLYIQPLHYDLFFPLQSYSRKTLRKSTPKQCSRTLRTIMH